MLCVVFEKAVPFFNPSGTYTGDFVSPWGPTECAGEMHDTFQISTMAFNGNRDGYFEGGFGARRTNNYDLFSFPNDGVAFLYHFSIFAVSDPTTELVNINSASLQGTSNPTKGGAQCAATNTGGYCMNFGFMGGNASPTSLSPMPKPCPAARTFQF